MNVNPERSANSTVQGSSPNEQREPMGSEVEDQLESKLPKIISFESLARCGEEIWIENGGQIYRLRRTRQGKLILTK